MLASESASLPPEGAFRAPDDSDFSWSDSVADDLADLARMDESERFSMPQALLDLTGITPHSNFGKVERERWDIAQALSRKLAGHGHEETAGKLRQCHSFQTHAVCDGCRKRVSFWNRCDLFWCPQCSPRLSKIRLDGLMWFVEKMAQPKHVVLTFRNVPTLTKEYLRSCRDSLAKLRRRRIWKSVRSGLWAMEITNEDKGWHVHFHLVIDAPWLPVQQLSATWKACTDCESFVVWIEDASRGSLKANLPRYVTKYTGKGFKIHTWDGAKLAEFVTAIDGCRTFGVFGALLGARSEWRDWLSSVRESRRKCDCGSCAKRYYSELEWQWKDNFTGYGSPCKPRPPTVEELGFVLRRIWPD